MDPRTVRTWLVRLFRLAALVLAATLIHFAAQRDAASLPAGAVSLDQARLVFSAAWRLGAYDASRKAQAVLDEKDALLGYVLTTSPESDDLIGYSGPSNLLVGVSPEGRVAAVRLLSSQDTPAHVAEVQDNQAYWESFAGWSPHDAPPPVEAVSGSTLTSFAVAEAVQRRLAGKHQSLRFPEPLTLEEVQPVYPTAARLEMDQPRAGWTRVENAQGEPLGYAVRTSPQADNVIGYAGPTEVWAAIDLDQKSIRSIRLRKSYDTDEYVDRVRSDDSYLNLLAGRTLKEWATLDFKSEGIEGVSGATQTSYAVAEGLRRRFAAELAAQDVPQESWPFHPRDLGLLAVVAGSLLICFGRFKGDRHVRLAWQVVLIAGFGFWFGDLLSIALLTGWARHGLPWSTAPVLVLMASIALLIPWGTRRQVYCHYLCPHGAAQEWLGQFRKLHRPLPEWLPRTLGKLPYVLLAVSLALCVAVPSFDLSLLEPFDAWVLKHAAVVPAIIAVVGLAASVFVPQAYCRFGCPSGALFKLIGTNGAYDRFRRRDGLVIVVLAATAAYLWLPRAVSARPDGSERTAQAPATELPFAGQAFGTTWRIRFRQQPAAAESLRQRIADELERIESTLSHWRPTSATSQFNASRTTVAVELPPELIRLVDHGRELGAATDGAFDLTVAPLVDAWGFGPSGPRDAPPTDEQLAALLKRTGWQRLQVDVEESTLRKRHPELQLDLGALLQGYAVDRLAELLDAEAVGDYLIEVGGELRARGAWKVAIENPEDDSQPLRTLVLRDAALATSGVYRRAPGTGAAHILDPRTGRQVEGQWRLVAVLAPTCLEADGWATALLASSDRALEIANREQIAALLCTPDGELVFSEPGERAFEAR